MRWTCVEGVARGHNLVVGLIFAKTVDRNTIPMKDLCSSHQFCQNYQLLSRGVLTDSSQGEHTCQDRLPQKPPYVDNFKTARAKTTTKYFQVRKTQKRIEPGIGAVEVAVIVVDPTMGHVLLIGLPLETAPRRAALTISSHSLKRLISTRELCAKPPGAPPPGGPPPGGPPAPGGPPPDGPPAPPGAPPLQEYPNQDNNISLEPVPPPIIGAL